MHFHSSNGHWKSPPLLAEALASPPRYQGTPRAWHEVNHMAGMVVAMHASSCMAHGGMQLRCIQCNAMHELFLVDSNKTASEAVAVCKEQWGGGLRQAAPASP